MENGDKRRVYSWRILNKSGRRKQVDTGFISNSRVQDTDLSIGRRSKRLGLMF